MADKNENILKLRNKK